MHTLCLIQLQPPLWHKVNKVAACCVMCLKVSLDHFAKQLLSAKWRCTKVSFVRRGRVLSRNSVLGPWQNHGLACLQSDSERCRLRHSFFNIASTGGHGRKLRDVILPVVACFECS